MMKVVCFLAVMLIPSPLLAQGGPGGGGAAVCSVTVMKDCDGMAQIERNTLGGACNAKACTPLPGGVWACPLAIGVTVTNGGSYHHAVPAPVGVTGSTQVSGFVSPFPCGELWSCYCLATGGNCLNLARLEDFYPTETSTGVDNCIGQ